MSHLAGGERATGVWPRGQHSRGGIRHSNRPPACTSSRRRRRGPLYPDDSNVCLAAVVPATVDVRSCSDGQQRLGLGGVPGRVRDGLVDVASEEGEAVLCGVLHERAALDDVDGGHAVLVVEEQDRVGRVVRVRVCRLARWW